MKRGINHGMMPSLLVAITLLTALHAQAAVVNFPDPNLEARIRKVINKPQGDIQQTDLVGTGFTTLFADNRNIADLTGLEYCTDLKWLDLQKNEIKDISALGGLTALNTLYLQGNDISYISALPGLTALQVLHLQGNDISDISALAGCTELAILDLSSNRIRDVSTLADLTKLGWIGLANNQISDVSALRGLTYLKHLDLEGNEIRGLGSWITIAVLEWRKALLDMGVVRLALLVTGVTSFLAVLVALGVWSRRVSKRYTREP